MPGIDLDLERQTALVADLGEYSDLIEIIRSDPRINTQYFRTGEKVRNGYFPTLDAETYAAMIARLKPPIIYEIGDGFSTLIARAVIRELGLSTELVVIDPQPRTDVKDSADELILAPAEDSSFRAGAIPSGGILFVDSSHIVRSSGDVTHIYNEIVPSLGTGVCVHVHEVFLPYDCSAFSRRLWWTEQYILQAMLAHCPRYRIELALRWLTNEAPGLMRTVYGSAVVEEAAHGGGSFWFVTVD